MLIENPQLAKAEKVNDILETADSDLKDKTTRSFPALWKLFDIEEEWTNKYDIDTMMQVANYWPEMEEILNSSWLYPLKKDIVHVRLFVEYVFSGPSSCRLV